MKNWYAMHTNLEETKDWGRIADFYSERAKGGVGLIITGGIAPNEEGAVFKGAAAMLMRKMLIITKL